MRVNTVSLSYIGSSRSRDTELVRDAVGNTLAPFNDMSVESPRYIILSLDAKDDTGFDNTDGHTNLGDDSDVSFVVTLSEGSFRSNDIVRVYSGWILFTSEDRHDWSWK